MAHWAPLHMPIRVLASVISKGKRLLICQRPLHKRHGGLWEFPGGKVKDGESDFELVYFVHVRDRVSAEAYVHRELGRFRTKGSKEFFESPISVAIKALEREAGLYPIIMQQTTPKRRGYDPRILPQAFGEVECTGLSAGRRTGSAHLQCLSFDRNAAVAGKT